MQWEAGRSHGGIREHRFCHSHSRVGGDRAWLDHADRGHHHRRHHRLAGVLVVGQIDSLAKARPQGLTGGEVVVHGQQTLSQALPAARRGSPHLVSTPHWVLQAQGQLACGEEQ